MLLYKLIKKTKKRVITKFHNGYFPGALNVDQPSMLTHVFQSETIKNKIILLKGRFGLSYFYVYQKDYETYT